MAKGYWQQCSTMSPACYQPPCGSYHSNARYLQFTALNTYSTHAGMHINTSVCMRVHTHIKAKSTAKPVAAILTVVPTQLNWDATQALQVGIGKFS